MDSSQINAKRTFWCFISYRHADNKELGRQWATWLHQAIETYEVPADLVGKPNERGEIIPERIFPVFRDEEELPVDADLASPIYRALDNSKYLLVICSPRAVESSYVASEIRYFKQLGHEDRVLAAMIDGEPNASWDAGKQAHGVDPARECFPEPLRHRVDAEGRLLEERTEPIAADFRLDDGTQGWTSPEAYRQALAASGLSSAQKSEAVESYRKKCDLMKLKIISGILGVGLGELTKRDAAYRLALAQKRARVRNAVLAVVSVLAIAAARGGVYSYLQQQEAIKQRKDADHQRTVAEAETKKALENLSHFEFSQAVQLVQKGDDKTALAYLAKVYQTNPAISAAAPLLYNTLMRQVAWPLASARPIDFGEPVSLVRFAPDGRRFLVVHAQGMFKPGTLQVFDTKTFAPIEKSIRPGQDIATAAFTPDGTRILTTSSLQPPQLWDATTGTAIGQPLATNSMVYGLEDARFNGDGSRVVTLATSMAASFGIVNNVSIFDSKSGAAVQPDTVVNLGTAGGRCISSDGSYIAVVSLDNVAQIWDVRKNQLIGDRVALGSPIVVANFSVDGERLFLAATGKAVVLDTRTGKEIGNAVVGDAVAPASLSPDATRFLTTDGAIGSQAVHIRSVTTGLPLGQAITDPLGFSGLVFCPSGNCFFSTSSDHFCVWDIPSGMPICGTVYPFGVNGPLISSADFSPDGTRVLASAGNEVGMWEVQPQHLPLPDWLPNLAEAFCGSMIDDSGQPAAVAPDAFTSLQARLANADGGDYWTRIGRWLFASANKRTVSPQSDLMPGDLTPQSLASPTFAAPGTGPTAAATASSAGSTAAGISSGTETVPALPAPPLGAVDKKQEATGQVKQAVTLIAQKSPKEALAHLARALRDDPANTTATTLIFTTLMSEQTWPLPLALPVYLSNPVKFIAYSPSGARFVTICASVKGDSSIQVWDAKTSARVGDEIEEPGSISGAAFSSDDSMLVTYGYSVTPHLWDASTGHTMGRSLASGTEQVGATKVFFSPDNKNLTKVGSGSTLSVWDTQTGNAIVPETDLSGIGVPHTPYFPYSLSTDGRYVASKVDNKTVLLWDVNQKQLIGNLTTGDGLSYFEFSQDGKHLIASAFSGPTRLWDVTSGKQLGQDIELGPGGTFKAHFSSDGTKFVVVGGNWTRLCDAATGLPADSVMYQENIVTDAVFSPNGAGLVTLGQDRIRLWDTNSSTPVSDSFAPHEKNDVIEAVLGTRGELLTGAGNVVQAWDLWPSGTLSPDWLPSLAEAVAGSRLNDASTLEPVAPEQLVALKNQLSTSTGTDYWSRVGRWYFADPSSRSISPQSDIALPDYVRCLINMDTPDSLDEAQRAGGQNASWLTQIAAKRAALVPGST